MSDERGDVVWSDDPFKDETTGRPWLVLNDETHPFGGQQYMTVALSTSGHDAALRIRDGIGQRVGRQSGATCFRGRSTHHSERTLPTAWVTSIRRSLTE